MQIMTLCTVFGLISRQPVNAQTTYPVPYQSTAYPLKTQISPVQIDEFNSIFEFGNFDPKKAIAIRTQLQPLCDTNDPVACYWLAKTYDWYEFGIGRDIDVPIAMKWYRKAADLNYTNAAYFLYEAYFSEYMGLKKNDLEATKWLNKAKELADGESKATILRVFAGFSDPNTKVTAYNSLSTIKRDLATHLAYLQQAYAIDPQGTADYYGDSLYKAKRYSEALLVLSNSNNPSIWLDVGRMYEKGEGTEPNIDRALFWYKKAAIEEKTDVNDMNPLKAKIEIYRLICLKKITPEQAVPIYTLEDYQALFVNHSDDRCNFNFQG
jgi:tetratricopeptide (TPR) repeat protein